MLHFGSRKCNITPRMLLIMAYTNDQLIILEKAIASGQLRVRFNDREVTYQSTEAMIRVRNDMRAELGVAVPASARSRLVSIQSGKGL